MQADPAANQRVLKGFSVAGPTDGHAVVLLHGVFFDKSMWQPVADLLALKFCVVSIDLPGHGDLHEESFTMAKAMRWLSEVLVATNIRPTALVGLSLGGFVAMAAVAQNPSIADALVLTGASREPGAYLRGPLCSLYRLLAHIPERVMHPIARLGVSLGCRPSVARVLLASGPWVAQGFRALTELPRSGFRERLRTFDGQVFLLNGRRDVLVRGDQDSFLAACRNGRLETIPGVGHLAPLQASDVFAEAVAAFVQDVTSKGAPGT